INNPKGLQMWILGWQADYPDPQDWLSTFFSKGAADNLINYGQNNNSYAAQQVAVQKQLDQADVDQDPANRLKSYADAEQKIVNDVGWIPLYQSALNYLQNPKIANYAKSYADPQNTIEPMDWANIFVTA
ncbi:MAG: peptide ABC transporter substrate-binding protein, partial [Ktedonobacteraceae bacterium]|nr:peptide ABC transporter substrate-binding protein [Ktedonobacteraceae bacterium]